MKSWIKPALCVAVLIAAIVISYKPVFFLVLTAVQRGISPAFATLIGAIVGFSGVIYATRAGFKNLITSHEAQAARDREARAEQQLLLEKNKESDRLHDRKVLAAALQGELIALLPNLDAATRFYRMQCEGYQAFLKQGGSKNTDAQIKLFEGFNVPIFQTNIGQLGLLGPSIAADVVIVFSRAINKVVHLSDEKAPIELAIQVMEHLVKNHQEWSRDIHHVVARLGSVQGFFEDPGILAEMKKQNGIDTNMSAKDVWKNAAGRSHVKHPVTGSE
ncbi:hypothetical protein [Phyllobacterium sp. 22552]|uniref:hypothetical protein n=1 Tax=Phyllobacterium sp. 22552 TaxID=3453941 RepID=UPI003F83B565